MKQCIGKCWLCDPAIGCRFRSEITAKQHKQLATEQHEIDVFHGGRGDEQRSAARAPHLAST